MYSFIEPVTSSATPTSISVEPRVASETTVALIVIDPHQGDERRLDGHRAPQVERSHHRVGGSLLDVEIDVVADPLAHQPLRRDANFLFRVLVNAPLQRQRRGIECHLRPRAGLFDRDIIDDRTRKRDHHDGDDTEYDKENAALVPMEPLDQIKELATHFVRQPIKECRSVAQIPN